MALVNAIKFSLYNSVYITIYVNKLANSFFSKLS